MSIIFDKTNKTITLNTDNTTYQMVIGKFDYLLHLYYGPKASGDMSYLLQMYDRGFSGNPSDAGTDRTFSLDTLPLEFSAYGNGDYRDSSFSVKNVEGVYGCDLRYVNHEIIEGKYTIPGLPSAFEENDEVETLKVELEDNAAKVSVTLLYGVFSKHDVITRTVVIENIGKDEIKVCRAFSASLDILNSDELDVITFNGRHGMERCVERVPLGKGAVTIGSRRGTSSHHHNPFVILCDKTAGENNGNCIGMLFLYSGNFRAEVFREYTGSVRMMMGIQDDMFEYPLGKGEKFYAPEAALCYSNRGFTELSHRYHEFINDNVIRVPENDEVRPILVNSWEAAFFDFDKNKLLKLADNAKELGVEMLVLDDGWFGNRNDDNTSLGDWNVNESKLGCSMGELSEEIHRKGLKFGLWIEPEMISEKSELYKKHPDWAYQIPGRGFIRSRNQLVLDFSRKEIVDYVFNAISEVIDNAEIDYIKMDMNRSITDVYTRNGIQNYGVIMYKYVVGMYDFIERLRKRYPKMLIEGCSGGGGRFDAGMLYYTPQIWTSDNTDAVERIKIQYGTSFAYPMSSMGAHVSVVPNQQTGRMVPMKTRTAVALAGTFGYELDLGLLSEEEKEEVRVGVKEYHKYYDLCKKGLYYRLTNPFENTEYAAWEFISKDRKEALVTVVTLDTHCNAPVNYVKMQGFDAEEVYKDEFTGKEYSGAALMHAGWPIPNIPGEYNAFQLHLVRK